MTAFTARARARSNTDDEATNERTTQVVGMTYVLRYIIIMRGCDACVESRELAIDGFIDGGGARAVLGGAFTAASTAGASTASTAATTAASFRTGRGTEFCV